MSTQGRTRRRWFLGSFLAIVLLLVACGGPSMPAPDGDGDPGVWNESRWNEATWQ